MEPPEDPFAEGAFNILLGVSIKDRGLLVFFGESSTALFVLFGGGLGGFCNIGERQTVSNGEDVVGTRGF